jgi:hypothetical protein
LEVGEGVEFAAGEGGAVGEFGRERFVIRRSAADGGGDPEIVELEAIVEGCGSGLGRMARAVGWFMRKS